MITIGFWQILMLGLLLVNLFLAANKHGQEKTGKHNFWIYLIASIVELLILSFGGFFG